MKINLDYLQVKQYLLKGTEEFLKKPVDIQLPRKTRDHYLGISSITGCGRLLWLSLNKVEIETPGGNDEPELRAYRIFDLGHIIEEITVQIITLGGGTITGTQDRFEEFGMFKGHCDGILDGKWIIEIKSMNDDSFFKFMNGKLIDTHYAYYVQCQMYMYYSGLRKAFLISTNKNNSAIEAQEVPYDEEEIYHHRMKAKNIIECKSWEEIELQYTDFNPEKPCVFCKMHDHCYGVSK